MLRYQAGFCLQPVEPQRSKRSRDNDAKSSGHITSSIVRRKRIVTEITREELTTNDLIDIDYAGKFVRLGSNPVPDVRLRLNPCEVGVKCFCRSGRRRPVAMQFPTFRYRSKELVATLFRWRY